MAVFMNMAKIVGAGPLMVMLTEVLGAVRSKPLYSTFMSSSVAMLTPLLPTLPYMSGRVAGSAPYRVTLSNAVLRRLAGKPSLTILKRRLVRNASPSPANMRVGSSPSRLKANVPAVYGKLPGTLSSISHLRISPWSSNWGRATLRIFVPDSDVVVSAVRISLSRILTIYSSPAYAVCMSGHCCKSLRAAGSCAALRWAARSSAASAAGARSGLPILSIRAAACSC